MKKRASRATALRADGVLHIRGLVLTQPISPTPWTRPLTPQSSRVTSPSDYQLRMYRLENYQADVLVILSFTDIFSK